MVAVPLVVGAVTWALASLVVGDAAADATPATSTVPEQPGTTVLAPGGRVLIPPGGSTPQLPGTVPGNPPLTTPPGLPPGWPEALAPPEGSTILSSIGNGDTRIVAYGSTQALEPLADLVKTQLEGGGFTITNEVRKPDGSLVSLQGEAPGLRAVVAVTPAPSPDQPPRLVTIVLNAR
ncbi:MAG: hypothetical protein ACR2JF_00320 [Iamia sp.]